MNRTWMAAGLALIGFLVGIAMWRDAWWREQSGVWQAERRQLVARADSLARAYRVDTVRTERVVTRWRTLVDTLTLTDSVPVPVEVVRTIVATCDSVIGACQQERASAVRLLAAKDSVIRQLERRPVRPWYVPQLGVGVAAGASARGGFDAVAGVTLGWRF